MSSNEWRLSATGQRVAQGKASWRRLNLVGLDRSDGGGYGDCKAAVGAPARFHWETASVKWVGFTDAPSHIRQTTNKLVRDRDLAVLEAARRAYRRFLAAAGMIGPTEPGEAH